MAPQDELCPEKIYGTWKTARGVYGKIWREVRERQNVVIILKFQNTRNNSKGGIEWLKRLSVPPEPSLRLLTH